MNEQELREQITREKFCPLDEFQPCLYKGDCDTCYLDRILICIKQAGWLPVEEVKEKLKAHGDICFEAGKIAGVKSFEEVKLEVLTEVEIHEAKYCTPNQYKVLRDDQIRDLKDMQISQATITKNEDKGKLYREVK
jgi:hypothetical protein